METNVYNIEGQVKEKMILPNNVFEAKINIHLMHEVVNAYLANQRSGNASTKTKGEVRGGGRKPWRQKGTGRARAGSIRSPLWRGGGITFGPHPRSYRQNLPKNKLIGALHSALSAKAKDGEIVVVEKLSLEGYKTKNLVELLNRLGCKSKTLIINDKKDENLLRVARNIPYVKVCMSKNLNAYDVLNSEKLLFNKDGIEIIAAIE